MDTATTISENSTDPAQDVRSYASQASDRSAGAIVHANIEGESDFAGESRALTLHLRQLDFPVQVVSPGKQQTQVSRTGPRAMSRELQGLFRDHLDLDESILYQSGAPTGWNLDFYGRCRVGRAAFGTDRIPDGWAERCNAADELWLPSEFHRETFAASGVARSKISVIPQAVDFKVFCPEKSPFRIASAKT